MKKGSAFTMGSEIEVSYAELLNERNKSFEKIRFMNSGTGGGNDYDKSSKSIYWKIKDCKS